MFQQFQKSQFSKSSFCKYFMFKGFINFLDSHKVFFVFCCNNNAVCSLSNYIKQMSTHINDFVFIVDLESLFRDGSCFPLCIMVSVWFVHIDDVLSKFTHFTTKYYIFQFESQSLYIILFFLVIMFTFKLITIPPVFIEVMLYLK